MLVCFCWWSRDLALQLVIMACNVGSRYKAGWKANVDDLVVDFVEHNRLCQETSYMEWIPAKFGIKSWVLQMLSSGSQQTQNVQRLSEHAPACPLKLMYVGSKLRKHNPGGGIQPIHKLFFWHHRNMVLVFYAADLEFYYKNTFGLWLWNSMFVLWSVNIYPSLWPSDRNYISWNTRSPNFMWNICMFRNIFDSSAAALHARFNMQEERHCMLHVSCQDLGLYFVF